MPPVVLRRVHASFSGQESAPISMQVQDMVQRAGCEFTAIHFAQTADWFEIWSKKAKEAKVVIIFYSDIYRGRFTVALKREAELIIELEGQGRIKAFVFDPTKASASDILVNLQDDAEFMGDWPAFKRFVANTTPVDVGGGAGNAASNMSLGNMSLGGGGSGSGGGASFPTSPSSQDAVSCVQTVPCCAVQEIVLYGRWEGRGMIRALNFWGWLSINHSK